MSIVYIIACGGTIAGTAKRADDLTGYTAGALSMKSIIRSVPGLSKAASIEGEQLCSIDSSDMTEALWLTLARRVTEIAARPDVTGIVIMHGTDTLEETAYFLQLTVQTKKPVVLVGAMRPATALSADGPLNLLDAVQLAARPETGEYGVVVAMNGTICSARFVEKTDTTHVDTFESRQLGILGYMQDGKPCWYQRPVRRHTWQSDLACLDCTFLPDVEIIYAYVGMPADVILTAPNRGVEAIVVAGLGHGRVPAYIARALELVAKKGLFIVRTSRTLGGVVTPVPDYKDFISGDTLTPQKAKILIQLALCKTRDKGEIQEIFSQY